LITKVVLNGLISVSRHYCYSCRLFEPDFTWGCVDQTRRWQDHHRLLHVTTDVATALSSRQMDRGRLKLLSK